jgi:hypothetical protein
LAILSGAGLPAVNQKAEKFEEIHLAPQTGLELKAGWLTIGVPIGNDRLAAQRQSLPFTQLLRA